MNSNLTVLANTNFTDANAHPELPMKKIMLLETNSPWETSGVGDANQFPKTQAGQLAEFNAVRKLIYELPHDDGEGVLWWYPEAVSPGTNYNGGATARSTAVTPPATAEAPITAVCRARCDEYHARARRLRPRRRR